MIASASSLTNASVPSLTCAVAIVVGWITLALVNAGLAQGRGRRGAVWFLLSLPFGPLATLALVLSRPARRKLF